jgi:hypothetical protein
MSSSKIKLNSSKFIINDKSDQFFVKNFGEIFGFNFKLRSLQNCTIQLLDWTSGVYMTNIDLHRQLYKLQNNNFTEQRFSVYKKY